MQPKKTESIQYCSSPSPLGEIWLGFHQEKLCFLSFGSLARFQSWQETISLSIQKIERPPPSFLEELDAYFAGTLQKFHYPTLFLGGSPFERKVWKTLTAIPHGSTRSYAWLASQVGNPRGFRAVGNANRKNPIALIYPCHRVVQSNGGLGGYAGGVDVKKRLLELERVRL